MAVSTDRWGRASLGHGTDDEPEQGGYERDGDAVPVGVQGRQGGDPRLVCATTGWHRDHARKALREALGPRRVQRLGRLDLRPTARM